MILVNGCSHTHGVKGAVDGGWRDRTWGYIAGKLMGHDRVVNLAMGGDSAKGICHSTIHWLETNTVKPDAVIIFWTYPNRMSLPPAGDSFTYHQQLTQRCKSESMEDSSDWTYVFAQDKRKYLQRECVSLSSFAPGQQDVPWNIQYLGIITEDELAKEEELRIKLTEQKNFHLFLIYEWAMAQNHVAMYCKANDIPYYYFNIKNWYSFYKMKDYLYLKPKGNSELFTNVNFFEGFMMEKGMPPDFKLYSPEVLDAIDKLEGNILGITGKEITDNMIDKHWGEEEHYFIGEQVAKQIESGDHTVDTTPNIKLLKQKLEERPLWKKTTSDVVINKIIEAAEIGKNHRNEIEVYNKEFMGVDFIYD